MKSSLEDTVEALVPVVLARLALGSVVSGIIELAVWMVSLMQSSM